MDAIEALEIFLSKALTRKEERYISFVKKGKNRHKFLNAIYHDLEDDLNQKLKVNSLPEAALECPGYQFSPHKNFGEPVSSLKDMVETMDESFLVVSADGKYGIYSPETYIDRRAFYAL